MGGGGADGHPKSPAMTAVHVYFLGTRHGGKLLQRRGKSSTPPTKSSTLTLMSVPILVLSPFYQCCKNHINIFVTNKKETVLQNHQPFTLILLIFCLGLDAGPTHPKPRALFIF